MYHDLEEFLMRKDLFMETHKFIEEMNNRESDSSYRAGHNMFSDWNEDEFNAILGLKDVPSPNE